MSVLAGSRIVLGVTGSIAAYKAADLASMLTRAGAEVDVALTQSAVGFVTPMTFEVLTQRPVVTADTPLTPDSSITHVEVGRAAHAIVVAPATASSIARLAHGLTEDIVTGIALVSAAPVVVAPTMEPGMFAHAATQANLTVLRDRGVHVVPPEEGRTASGAMGQGRLPPTERLVDALRLVLGRSGPLEGRTIAVSAGGTREFLDPVRFLGNRATGTQGVALARAALERGANVRLVLGAGTVTPPYGVETTNVITTHEMLDALRDATDGCHALIMNAAVGDFRPASPSTSKIKRRDGIPSLELAENPSLLESLTGDFVRVAFAAETDDYEVNARAKLEELDLDAVVVNDVAGADRGFAASTNAVTMLTRGGDKRDVPLQSKEGVADAVLDLVEEFLLTH